MKRTSARGTRLYRRLLLLLPFEFRREFGSEMTEVFDAQRGDARKDGSMAILRLWLSTIGGILRIAPRQHVELLRQDIAYGLRTLRGSPVFALAAVAALALGIGANVAVFNLLQAVLLNPLPVHEPSRLVSIQVVDRQTPGYTPISTDNFHDLRNEQDSFTRVAGYSFAAVTADIGDNPQELFAAAVSADYFDVLGVPAALGRTIRPEDDGAPGANPVGVLGHRLWTESFGADPAIVGRTIRLNGHPFTVVGVTPGSFRGTQTTFVTDLFIPLSMYDTVAPGTPWFTGRRWRWLSVIARLRDGVSMDSAAAETTVIGDRLAATHPDVNRGRSLAVLPIVQVTVNPNQHTTIAQSGVILYGVVAVVLFIACVNLASLLLARSAGRAREIALRTALGASRGRIVRQLLTESLMLGVTGGAAGLVVAYWTQQWLWASRPANFLRAQPDLSLDGTVLLFTLALSVGAGLLFGIVPALQSSRIDVITTLKEAGRQPSSPGRQRVRSALVVAEVALSVVALVAAGILMRSLSAAERIDPGFDAPHLVRMNYSLRASGYGPGQAAEFHQRVIEAVREIPGVRGAAVADRAPLSGGGGFTINIAGRAPEPGALGFLVQVAWVSPGYFPTVGIPLVAGRPIDLTDRADSRLVAVINETMARRFWPDTDPVGQRFTNAALPAPIEIVGVARDSKYITIGEEPQLFFYMPLPQRTTGAAAPVTLLVASQQPRGPVVPAVRNAMKALNASIPLTNVLTGDDLLHAALWGPRTAASLVAAFGLLALLLATIGIYGVMAYSVTQARQEIGLRLTLGATPGGILGSIVWQGVRLAGGGAIVGVLVALAAADTLSALLYGVSPRDLVTFIGMPMGLVSVAALACCVPGLRAARIDPAMTLR